VGTPRPTWLGLDAGSDDFAQASAPGACREMSAAVATSVRPDGAFRHEALFYEGEAEFVAGAGAFVREGVEAGEPTLVVVDAMKIGLLRDALPSDADTVQFADMADVGKNPARIIPAWVDFVERHAGPGRRLRGVGEPIWAGRSADELVECQRHETLLNLAFADSVAWWLVCPYDTGALDPLVIAEAERSHPYVRDAHGSYESEWYGGLGAATAPFDVPLPDPPPGVAEFALDGGPLAPLRAFVADQAARAGLGPDAISDLVLAANEVATNSLRHGGGRGLLRMWCEGQTLVCDVRDGGRIQDPLAGRRPPSRDDGGGRGLWLVNQLCDLVQVRSTPRGSVVRLHVRAA
jgi:anti-sigma regulatory factor (Ser/Thr protein kinase)